MKSSFLTLHPNHVGEGEKTVKMGPLEMSAFLLVYMDLLNWNSIFAF